MKHLLAIWFLITASSLSVAQQPEFNQIEFYTENYPPANFMVDGELKGITIDSLRVMWQRMGIKEQPVSLVPWARGYRNVLLQPNSALFTMSQTAARQPLFKWVGPFFKSVHVLMAKKSSNIKIKNLGELFEYRVAAIRGDISEISLIELGYPSYNMAKVANLQRAFYMMESGRVDMMMVSIHGFKHLTEQLKVDPKLYESVWTVNEIGNYIAFSKLTPDALIKQYQQVFEATASERLAIKQQYGLPEREF